MVTSARIRRSAMSLTSRSAAAGFTLIEAMITLVVLGILATVAVPAFNSMVLNSRIRNTAYEMLSSLGYAKSEAIKRNGDAIVSPAASGWTEGWTVEASGVGTPLKTVAVAGNISVSAVSDGGSFDTPVTFGRNGRLSGAQWVRFTVKPSDPADSSYMRCVYIDFSGRPSLERDDNKDGDCSNG